MVDLAKTSIDFQDLVTELEADLQARESFKALFPGETSKIFTEHGAGITALMLYHINSAAQNAFFPTAFSKQAVYALAASLGQPPRRKLGAQLTIDVTVNTTLGASVTLPKFSRFSARGVEWYTIEDNIIPAGAAGQIISITLRQGERITESFPATGNDNQRIEIGEDFNIDQNFLTVTVGTTLYTSNGPSLLDAEQGDTVYAEQTSSNGRVLILFGNNIIGSIPSIGESIEISYSNTIGIDSNSSITGDTFSYLELFDIGGGTFLDLSGVSTTTASSGADEESVEQVKNTAPKLFAANKRAVSRTDYEGHILSFTGASAAAAWGEFEEANQKGFADLTMMNRAYITAVPAILNDNNDIFATGDGSTLTYAATVAGNIIPGSMIVTSNTAVWYDYDGKGLLMSPTISFNEVGTGTAAASENNGIASQAWDNNQSSQWQSITTPTVFNPIRLAYDFGGATQTIRSVRLSSAPDPVTNTRGFPKQIIILGSTAVSPDLTTRDDWEVIRGTTLLDEPGYQTFSRWIPVDDINSTTAYRWIAIEILDRHGTGTETKVSSVEVQAANTSLVNYETGVMNLTYTSGNAPTGDIVLDNLIGNFSTAQKTDILNYLNDLNHFTTLINFRDAVSKPVDVIADVYHLEGFESNTILAEVQSAITALFTVSGNSIAKPLYLSDIYQAIQDITGVDYCIISSPTLDTFAEIDQFIVLNSQTISVFPTDR